jgi:putative oxidoreductase
MLIGVPPTTWWVSGLILLARLYAGITIASAGISKLPTPDWMRDQVAEIGFPAPAFFSYAASITEFAGGVLLAIGLFTRPASFLLAITLAVAAFGYHKVAPFTEMHIAQGFVWLFVMFMATGSGRISLDALLHRALVAPSSTHTPRASRPRPILPLALAAIVAATPVAIGTYRELALEQPPAVDPLADLAIERVNLAGTFNSWNLTALPLVKLPDSTRWTADVVLPAGTSSFKFVANGSWDFNLGDDSTQPILPNESIQGIPNGGDITIEVPESAPFQVELDTATRTFRVVPK